MDFFEDAVTFLEKEEAVEEITSGDQIYQAHLDLVQAKAREVFEHINLNTSTPAVPQYDQEQDHRSEEGRADRGGGQGRECSRHWPAP
jgi:hypothetical protein